VYSRGVLKLPQVTEKCCFRETTGSGVQQFFSYSCFCMLSLTSYNSKAKQESNTTLGMHNEMDPYYQWRIMLTSCSVCLHASMSDYTWCPVIDHLTWVPANHFKVAHHIALAVVHMNSLRLTSANSWMLLINNKGHRAPKVGGIVLIDSNIPRVMLVNYFMSQFKMLHSATWFLCH